MMTSCEFLQDATQFILYGYFDLEEQVFLFRFALGS